MELLNYQTLKESGYDGYILEKAPEKVLQFGEGNFLRAFVNYWFDLANEKAGWNGKCCLVQPIAPGLTEMINKQEGLYTLYLRGSQNGQKVDDKRVISCVSRCLNPYEEEGYRQMMEVAVSDDLEIIVSNTTEAGNLFKRRVVVGKPVLGYRLCILLCSSDSGARQNCQVTKHHRHTQQQRNSAS